MTLAPQRAAAVVFVNRVFMRRQRTRGGSSVASLGAPRVLGRLGRTVPRFHAVHLSFGWGNDSLRDVPLQTDGELKYYQRCDHPVCRSATHDPQRTPLAVMREELRHAVDPVNADRRVPVHASGDAGSTVRRFIAS